MQHLLKHNFETEISPVCENNLVNCARFMLLNTRRSICTQEQLVPWRCMSFLQRGFRDMNKSSQFNNPIRFKLLKLLHPLKSIVHSFLNLFSRYYRESRKVIILWTLFQFCKLPTNYI